MTPLLLEFAVTSCCFCVGSGTGYLSAMVGMLLGPRGINRGIEIYSANVKYARERINNFVRNSPFYDPTQFSFPEFQVGNGLLLDPQHGTYDRVYCGADVPQGYDGVMKCLLNPGGILVMPYNGAVSTGIISIRHNLCTF